MNRIQSVAEKVPFGCDSGGRTGNIKVIRRNLCVADPFSSQYDEVSGRRKYGIVRILQEVLTCHTHGVAFPRRASK